MHPMDIFIALCLIGAVVATYCAIRYFKDHPPASPSGKDLATTIAASSDAAWEAVKRDLPSIVSADLAQAKADGAALLKRAQAAEAALIASEQAHALALASVAARVAAAVTGSPELPPSAVAPAVAAAQAADAAKVVAFADKISPALPAPN